MSELKQQSTLAVPFGQTTDFVLACVNPPGCYNFYPSLENAALDRDRANGLACFDCRRPFDEHDRFETIHGRVARRCICGELTWPDRHYEPMTWDQFEQAQRDFYLEDPAEQITSEKYTYALEVLPPDCFENKGGLVSFLMCEHYSGPYTHQYVQMGYGDRATYWTKMVDSSDRRTWMTYESLSAIEPAALAPCMTCGVQTALMVKPHGTWQRGECGACKSGHHCDKRCGREARPGADLCDECGKPAEVVA